MQTNYKTNWNQCLVYNVQLYNLMHSGLKLYKNLQSYNKIIEFCNLILARSLTVGHNYQCGSNSSFFITSTKFHVNFMHARYTERMCFDISYKSPFFMLLLQCKSLFNNIRNLSFNWLKSNVYNIFKHYGCYAICYAWVRKRLLCTKICSLQYRNLFYTIDEA